MPAARTTCGGWLKQLLRLYSNTMKTTKDSHFPIASIEIQYNIHFLAKSINTASIGTRKHIMKKTIPTAKKGALLGYILNDYSTLALDLVLG